MWPTSATTALTKKRRLTSISRLLAAAGREFPRTNCLASKPLYTACKVSAPQELAQCSSRFPYLSYIIKSDERGVFKL